MTKREWILAILEGNRDVPIAQHWMGYFNGELAKKLTPRNCHYYPIWLFDVLGNFDMSGMGKEALDKMIAFNNYTGRCFACLGKGANQSFGHGGPGEFFVRIVHRDDNYFIVEYETGVRAKIQFHPHFYHIFAHPVKTLSDLNQLTFPDPTDSKRYKGFAEDAQYLKSKGEYVLGSLNGFFSGLHYFLMDYQEVLMGLITDPKLIYAATERLGQWNLIAAEKMIDSGADCIVLCDDLGSKQNLLMSPNQYRTYFKPWHKKLCELVHGKDALVHLHSHGAIINILDDLADCGFDFINPFDPEEGFDLEQVLKNYSDKFVVVGGFPTSFWEWSAQQQQSHLEKMADLGRKHGRLIFMDSGGIPENVSRKDYQWITQLSRRLREVDKMSGCV